MFTVTLNSKYGTINDEMREGYEMVGREAQNIWRCFLINVTAIEISSTELADYPESWSYNHSLNPNKTAILGYFWRF